MVRAESIERFIEYLNDFVSFEVPGLSTKVGKLKTWLCGTYVTYRYGFDLKSIDEVVREVIHIKLEGASLKFTMTFLERSPEGARGPHVFEGYVLPVGESLLLLGLNFGEVKHDRGRCIFFRNEGKRECKIGIMSGTRLEDNLSPCAACIVLVRTQSAVEHDKLKDFMHVITKTGGFDEIVLDDFGVRHRDALRAFLDNRPLGVPKDEDLMVFEAKRSDIDPVLRLDLSQFNQEMRKILRNVFADDTINSSFKGARGGAKTRE